METAWTYWTKEIADVLSVQLGSKVSQEEIISPPEKTMGDFSFACFRFAKEQKKSPAEVARELAQAFPKKITDLDRVEASGPYVNFYLASDAVISRVVREIEQTKNAYGKGEPDETRTILFEYANLNTHKETHIGHFRNLILGCSFVRILKQGGIRVIPVSYINDVGSNVAKCLWHLVLRQGHALESLTIAQADTLLAAIPLNERNGTYLGKIYTEASRASEENEQAKQQISFVQNQLETHAPVWEHLWQETRRWCLEEFQRTFEELKVSIERQYFESEVIDEAGPIVDRLVQEGIAKESQGAVIVDFADKRLGVMMIRKSDGNLLYASKDLPLALQKIKEYPSLTHSYVLVDDRQTLYFKQLAVVLRSMGVKQTFDLIGYGLVTLPEGAMSSRKGNIVTYQGLRDTVIAYAREEIISRHPDWSEESVVQTAWSLAMGGMKYAILRQDAEKTLVFDMKEALSFDGATGPYCQYSIIRLTSILRKAEKAGHPIMLIQPFFYGVSHPSEKNLALQLASFPRAVERAARDFRPSVIAQWCLETAQRINDFYRDVPILDGEPEWLQNRLRLVDAARRVLTQGLDLLGIPLPDEM